MQPCSLTYKIEAFDDVISLCGYNPETHKSQEWKFFDWESLIVYLDIIGLDNLTIIRCRFYQQNFFIRIALSLVDIKQKYQSWPKIPVKATT